MSEAVINRNNTYPGANMGATRVRTIPATLQRHTAKPLTATLRVAAYARVSTDEEEQQTSYEAQVDYYTKKIKERPEWIFVSVYTDKGITGTNTKKRDGFNRMVKDALDGKIDLILTKSVSRFARNTVDTLSTIRKLKERGVAVFFEEQNIDTLDSKGELLITIMSSLAQEESRSISENVTWGWRKRISDGKVSLAYSQFLGYEKGVKNPDGSYGPMQIVESEAKIVREIYAMFLDGQTPSSIASILTERGIPTPAGKVKWTNSTVKSILTNEKYKGDALLQKTFTPDFLSKKAQKNCGEVPQVYVENSHPAIVTPEVFELVQYEMSRRRKRSGGRSGRAHTSAVSIFSNRLVCGECGAYYGSKVWHSNDPYRCIVWRCNRKYDKGAERCHTPHVREEEIKVAFQTALGRMLEHKSEILTAYEGIITDLTNTDKLTQESYRLQTELDSLYLELNQMVRRNAEMVQDQDEYNRAFDALTAKCETLKERQRRISDQLAEKAGRKMKLEAFIERIRNTEGLNGANGLGAFDEKVFAGTVEQVIVNRGESKKEKRLTFRFKDGTEITV